MKKEVLTIENCKRDLRYQLRNQMIARGIFSIGLILACGLLSLQVTVLNSFVHWAGVRWLISAFWIFPAAYVLLAVRHWVVVNKRIRSEAFFVSEAKLNNITELEKRIIGGWLSGDLHFRRIRYRYDRNVFYFSSHGRYVVPDRNFTWSKEFRMSDDGLNNYSICGDDFYLLVYTQGRRKGKVAYAYPAKLFEWHGAGSNRSHE